MDTGRSTDAGQADRSCGSGLGEFEAMTRLLPDDGPQKARIFPNAVDAPTYLQAGDDLCPTDLEAIPHPRSGP